MTTAERGCDTLSTPPAPPGSGLFGNGDGALCGPRHSKVKRARQPGQPAANGAQPGSQSDIDAYADFQRTMRQFMRVQERLLEAYFANETFQGGTVGTHVLRPADTMPPVPNGHTEAHGVATEASTEMTIVAPTVKPPPMQRNEDGRGRLRLLPSCRFHRPCRRPPSRAVRDPRPPSGCCWRSPASGQDTRPKCSVWTRIWRRIWASTRSSAWRSSARSGEPPYHGSQSRRDGSWRRWRRPRSMRAILAGSRQTWRSGSGRCCSRRWLRNAGLSDVPVAFDSAAASGPEPEAAERLLLEIASERTGYPAEMLGLDANLEADLGIDSIKRVEIIGAFRRAALPGSQSRRDGSWRRWRRPRGCERSSPESPSLEVPATAARSTLKHTYRQKSATSPRQPHSMSALAVCPRSWRSQLTVKSRSVDSRVSGFSVMMARDMPPRSLVKSSVGVAKLF